MISQPLRILPLLVAVVLLWPGDRATAETTPTPDVQRARAAIKPLAEGLKSELTGALKAGGAAAAVEKCRSVAPEITRGVSTPTAGLIVSRTALKVRNPQNSPDAHERAVLEEFVAKLKAGTDPAALEHVAEIKQGDVTLVRYMKAIPMAEAPCAACHGTSEKLDQAAMDAVKRLYPSDQAVGFVPGELRGAFSVTIRKP